MAQRSGGGAATSPASLNRLILVTSDAHQDEQFLAMLGLQPVYAAKGWRAYGRSGESEGSVEVLNSPPLDGAVAAVGFEVDDVQALHERIVSLNYEHTEPMGSGDGSYFFVRDAQGRFWQFSQRRQREPEILSW